MNKCLMAHFMIMTTAVANVLFISRRRKYYVFRKNFDCKFDYKNFKQILITWLL
jgi:hypothetical protein